MELERDKAQKDGHVEDGKKSSSRYWTPDEHQRFLDGLELYGQKDIKAISRYVRTRNATQVRTALPLPFFFKILCRLCHALLSCWALLSDGLSRLERCRVVQRNVCDFSWSVIGACNVNDIIGPHARSKVLFAPPA